MIVGVSGSDSGGVAMNREGISLDLGVTPTGHTLWSHTILVTHTSLVTHTPWTYTPWTHNPRHIPPGHKPPGHTHPWTPPGQTPHEYTPSPITVNERALRILLECFLVRKLFVIMIAWMIIPNFPWNRSQNGNSKIWHFSIQSSITIHVCNKLSIDSLNSMTKNCSQKHLIQGSL